MSKAVEGKMQGSGAHVDTIFPGDCRDLLGDVPSESVDLVVSSPPYNLGKEYERKQALQLYLDEQSEVLSECVRVLKPTGSVFWQVGAFANHGALVPLDIRFFPILESLGLVPRNRIVWIRQHGVHARKKFSCRHETILWFTKGNDYYFDLDSVRVPQKYRNKTYHKGEKHGQLSCNPLGKNPSDVWAFRNVKHNHEERTIHPCQFPEDLITRIVLAACPPRGLVLDPFMGVGTVAVVARDHGRHYMGAETDSRYLEVAQRRLSGRADDTGSFANLKTLRDHVERTGAPIQQFRYDVQVRKQATDRSQARIFSEDHHRDELFRRLDYEEAAFIATTRGEAIPDDPMSPAAKRAGTHQKELTLFE